MKLTALTTLVGVALLGVAHAAAPAPKFVKKPSAKKVGARVRIEFAVDRETDVAVFIEDSKGKVVRHLVAGVLGKNAPKPLKSGLSQRVEWDGKADYGKPAGSGPFKVRVAIGLGAKFDKVVAEDKQNFGHVRCMGVGPDGTLYVSSKIGTPVPNWPSDMVVAIGRDGKYKRTVMPFPASIKKSKLGKLPTVNIDGRLSPLVHKIAQRNFYPGGSGAYSMAVTREGMVLRMMGGFYGAAGPYLTAVGGDGGLPWDYRGSNLRFRIDRPKPPSVCVSGDGKYVYVYGLQKSAALYRVAIPERKKLEKFFGDAKVKGSDKTHFGGIPGGMAIDGKGHLLVPDSPNSRVVVLSEKDGSFVGSFPAKRPLAVAVDQGTGEVYLTRSLGKRSSELVKLSGWKAPRELAILKLKGGGRLLAVDSGAKPSIIWVYSGGLQRVQAAGGKLVARRVNSSGFSTAAFGDISVDRFRPDQEVYAMTNRRRWMRFNEATGKISNISPRGKGNLGKGLCIMPGPDGNIYGPEWPSNLYKWDRSGKEVAWKNPEKMTADFWRRKAHKKTANGTFMPVCMTFMSHTLGIRHDGHLFMLERPPAGKARSPKSLYEYLPSGQRIDKPIIWKVSDVAVGPKFDQQGNIYIAEAVKPKGKLVPKEFESVIASGPKRAKRQGTPAGATMTMYGSIIKFSPKGGTIEFTKSKYGHAVSANPFKGTPKLDPAIAGKVTEVRHYKGDKFQSLSKGKVIGADWIHMGISHIELFYCNCESTRFDVDEFGRVWYPDLGRFRVVCLDTNGNEIMHFGAYGNADDPMGKAEPAARFAWLIGVGMTEKYAYTGDSINRRLLRCKKVYAAEATCSVP
jgi:hypothetical protein